VPDAYTKLPPPFKSVAATPGKGGRVTMFTIAYQPAPTPREQNQYWQELEKRLGVTWEPTITPQPAYGEKSAALLAGGDLPELFYLNPGQNAAPQLRAIDQGAFGDLTPFLSGDARKEYPNIAPFPDFMWKNVAIRNKLYGVPKPSSRNGNIPFYRSDWARKLGKAPPKNADEVYELLVGFSKNDPDGNGQADTFGMSKYGTGWDNTLVAPMFRVPNGWVANPNGSLTNAMETEEFKAAVAYFRRLYAGGAYHPDAASMTFNQAKDTFLGGKTGLHSEGFGSMIGFRQSLKLTAGQAAELAGLVPPGHDGGQGVTYNGPGYFGFTGVPTRVARDRERVKELLSILNYLAAPFGSEEAIFLGSGLEGVHHELRPDGSRPLTDKGKADRGDLVYLMGGESVYFYPDVPGEAQYAQGLAREALAIGTDSPTLTLYSQTNSARGAELTQLNGDRLTAIVTGREPLGAIDAWVQEWRSRGGDEIRKEYEQALKEQ
jgi:putative aldouronate transport system substrate-binding protein